MSHIYFFRILLKLIFNTSVNSVGRERWVTGLQPRSFGILHRHLLFERRIVAHLPLLGKHVLAPPIPLLGRSGNWKSVRFQVMCMYSSAFNETSEPSLTSSSQCKDVLQCRGERQLHTGKERFYFRKRFAVPNSLYYTFFCVLGY